MRPVKCDKDNAAEKAGTIFKIGIWVDDIEECIKYFEHFFNLEVTDRFPAGNGEDYVFLKAANMIIELMPKSVMDKEGIGNGLDHISFLAEDMDETLRSLGEKGAKMVKEPFKVGDSGITLADIEGPEGMLIRLYNRKTK